METAGKKLICYSSKQSFLQEINSKLSSSPRNKKIQRVSRGKIWHIKPRSHMRKVRRKNNLNGKQMESVQKGSAHCFARRMEKKEKRKRKKEKIVRDEASCLQRRARYLLIKMKLELNLIDAYSGDGWKGQSREKIKPEKELQRAEKQILRCKLGIRDVIHQLELLGSEGRIEDSVMYPDGSVFHEHIFCAKCKSREAFLDNDIILCDGTCNCGFHQKCLEPPLEKIPPGDQGWLCKICERKLEILEVINAHIGTSFTVNSSWEDIFKEATVGPDTGNALLDPAQDWPSEDSEDEDYHPERTANSNSRTGIEDNMSDDAGSLSSLFCSSDEFSSYSVLRKCQSWDVAHKSRHEFESVNSIIRVGSSEASDREIICYRRQRRDVDYKKLYDEMFGKELNNNEQQSEDEDWGPYRRKRRRELDAGTTMANCREEDGSSSMVLHNKSSCDKRTIFRIPHDAVEKLRQVFAENELPSRDVKENLSKQLGISAEKVGMWFKNARYAALKSRKAEVNNQSKIHNTTNRSSTDAGKQGSDGLASIDSSYFLPLSSIVRVPRNLKKSLQRKNLRSIATSLKSQQKRAANGLPIDKIQKLRSVLVENQFPSISIKRNSAKELDLAYPRVSTWCKDDSHLKRQVSGPKKFSSQRIFDAEGSTPQIDEVTEIEQLYLAEMERMFTLEDRLQKLKAALLTCKDSSDVPTKIHSREQNLIYVPIAEVKEKS